MKLNEIKRLLNLEDLIEDIQGRDVSGVYVSDLLSDVMANARPGELWITLQTHVNIVAVASLKNLSAIIITNNRKPDDETIKKAREERIAIFRTPLSTFEIAGRLYRILKGD